jgi:uncharacterized protein with HEPN domain
MWPERDVGSMQDMLAYAREAAEAIRGRSRADLDEDRFFNLGLQRLVEIIGEAAARVSRETQDQLPRIPWQDITGMRNRLIHGYDVVDCELLWDTITNDLPPLIAELENILPPLDRPQGD